MRMGMGHTAVAATSVTLQNWQHGAKENLSNFTMFNRKGDMKTSIIQMGPNILNVG